MASKDGVAATAAVPAPAAQGKSTPPFFRQRVVVAAALFVLTLGTIAGIVYGVGKVRRGCARRGCRVAEGGRS